MATFPRSAYDLTGGIVYFARMCDKIRLHASGELPADYRANLGNGFDARTCKYLKVDYAKLRDVVLGGANDDETLEWCFANGRRLDDIDVLVWNGFSTKRGWRDADGGSEVLRKAKESSGLTNREDILTMFDYYDVDEQRRD